MHSNRHVVTAVIVALIVAIPGCNKSETAPSTPPASGSGGGASPPATRSEVRATTPATTPTTAVYLNGDTVNLNEVAPSTTSRGVFELVNQGQTPVKVVETKPSCVCTDIDDIVDRTLAPGDRLVFGASLRAPATPGAKDAKVYVNLDNGSMLTAHIVANVVMSINPEPPYVDAMRSTSGSVSISSRDGAPFRILSAGGDAPVFVNYSPDQPPRSSYQLQWSVAGLPCEGMKWWWIVETDRPDALLVPLRLRHRCTAPSQADPTMRARNWKFQETIILAGRVASGATNTYSVGIDNFAGTNVRGVAAVGAGCTASLVTATDTGEAETGVEFSFSATGAPGKMFYELVEVTTGTGAGRLAIVGLFE